MQVQGLADLVADGMDRRKRRHRFLEDDRDVPTPEGPHLATVPSQLGDIDAAAEALTRKGVAFHRRDNVWGRTLDFTDPEGNACQIRDEVGFGP